MKLLEDKIHNQKKELSVINDRCKELQKHLSIVYRCDYVKSRLQQIDKNDSYRNIIANKSYKCEIEDIFELPFKYCLRAYDDLLQKRNAIVHKFTQNTWDDAPIKKRVITNKSLSELAKCGY
jgi:hypothetical protein